RGQVSGDVGPGGAGVVGAVGVMADQDVSPMPVVGVQDDLAGKVAGVGLQLRERPAGGGAEKHLVAGADVSHVRIVDAAEAAAIRGGGEAVDSVIRRVLYRNRRDDVADFGGVGALALVEAVPIHQHPMR